MISDGVLQQLMFAKILQNNQLSFQEQKDILKNVIQVNLKQNLPEVKLQLTHNYQQLKPILIKHWKYALRIAFALIPWQSARDFIEGRREGTVFDLIITIAEEGDLKHSGQYIVMELLKVYPDPWRCLVILSLAAEIISKRVSAIEDYYWFLAGFIRISAGIIQSFLTIKNEPTKSNQDRIDKDLVLVDLCESWIANSYLTLFNNLQIPQTSVQKQIILSALSQIIGALYESQRQGHLKVDLLHKIQQGAAVYLFKGYRIDQVKNIFIARLKQLKYFNPIKKIQIPDKYTEKSNIQTEGLCWIINRYLVELQGIISSQHKLDYSLLLYSQILPLPYKLKDSLIANIHKLIQTTTPSAQFEISYPLGLLLFHVYHFHRAQFAKLAQKLGFNQDKIVKINRLKRLLSINIENLNVEKTQFVLDHLDEESLVLRQALLLIKSVQFNFANPQLAKSVTVLFEKVSKCHGELGRKTVLLIISRERQEKRNVELCHQLQKIYSI